MSRLPGFFGRAEVEFSETERRLGDDLRVCEIVIWQGSFIMIPLDKRHLRMIARVRHKELFQNNMLSLFPSSRLPSEHRYRIIQLQPQDFIPNSFSMGFFP